MTKHTEFHIFTIMIKKNGTRTRMALKLALITFKWNILRTCKAVCGSTGAWRKADDIVTEAEARKQEREGKGKERGGEKEEKCPKGRQDNQAKC